MTQFLFVNPPNEMPIFVANLDFFFNGKLTVPAAETCQKMTHIRKAINSGTTPMTCHFLWQLLTFFWREINSSCSRKASKDGTYSKSHQLWNVPNEVPTFVAILDFFWRKINSFCSRKMPKDGTSEKPSILEPPQ